MLSVAELEYTPDTALRFQALLDRRWPVFLDSGQIRANDARFDILAADPYVTLTTRGGTTEIRSGSGVELSDRDPLKLLEERLGEPAAPVPGRPFAGGAIGYFAYDLGRRYERIEGAADADIDLPEMAVGLYDWAVVVDHRDARAHLVGAGRDARTAAQWDRLVETLRSPQPRPGGPLEPFELVSPVRASVDREAYERAFARVERHIGDGDCYQVNLTQRFSARCRGHAWHAYRKLRRINPAPYSAYLDVAGARILSSSPERFINVDGRRVETKPIKGTRPRAAEARLDRALADELRASAKDRAENVMIVDLLRNDLGKCCVPGSIEVSKLFDVETFANVHHLVSTVTGRLAPGMHALDLLRACFPGGSITGAPKVRAMQIIEALEPQRRSVYCGSIGYVGFDGNMDTNIAIRTLVQHRDTVHAWAGGGIVADSSAASEYQESLDKAAALLEVLRADRVREAS